MRISKKKEKTQIKEDGVGTQIKKSARARVVVTWEPLSEDIRGGLRTAGRPLREEVARSNGR